MCSGPGSARGRRGKAATSAARARSVPPGARGSDGADHGGSHPRTQRLGPPSWISGTLDPEESEGDRDRMVAPGRPGRSAGRPARAGGPPDPMRPRVRDAAAEWGGGRRRAPRGARPGPQDGRCRHGPAQLGFQQLCGRGRWGRPARPLRSGGPRARRAPAPGRPSPRGH
ncbi:collagen alpha-2(I) chain-like [Enhydra lutris kenyoni]|uniref:Collagen alpha-2(I) chain-like n=1 Tax=Enhydra lutris kenyoni TaxID=391180 RepID=A0A2Y9JJ53_ENHLU|nr:collagen alpha-2(I) chain-like [Enhydra lutris kenyoni]